MHLQVLAPQNRNGAMSYDSEDGISGPQMLFWDVMFCYCRHDRGPGRSSCCQGVQAHDSHGTPCCITGKSRNLVSARELKP